MLRYDRAKRSRVQTCLPNYIGFHLIIPNYGYAETSNNAIFTTKGTKRTKMENQMARFFLRDLRVLRGASSNDRSELELLR